MEIDQLLVIEACFQQAYEDARLLAQAERLNWKDCVHVLSSREAFDQRIAKVQAKDPQRVNFPTQVKKTMKMKSPGWRLSTLPQFEELLFHKPIAPEIDLLLQINKIHGFGLGKMFRVELGIYLSAHPHNTRLFRDNIFRIFGDQFELPTWAYHTKEELDCCILELVELLNRVCPIFESCCLRYLSPLPARLPELIVDRRNLSARDALAEALTLAGMDTGDTAVKYLASFPRLAWYQSDVERSRKVLSEGKLDRFGQWRIITTSREDSKRELIADVPYSGPIRMGSAHPTGVRLPIRDWIDSTQVAEILRTDFNFEANHLQLQGYDPPHWLSTKSKNGETPRVIRLNASTGEAFT